MVFSNPHVPSQSTHLTSSELIHSKTHPLRKLIQYIQQKAHKPCHPSKTLGNSLPPTPRNPNHSYTTQVRVYSPRHPNYYSQTSQVFIQTDNITIPGQLKNSNKQHYHSKTAKTIPLDILAIPKQVKQTLPFLYEQKYPT